MRILLVSNIFSPHVIGGYELGCLGLARAAQKAGHQVRVLTSQATGRLRKRATARDLEVMAAFAPIYSYETVLSGVPARIDPSSFGGVLPANVVAFHNHIESFQPHAIWVHNPLGLGPVGILETAANSRVPTAIHLNDHLDGTVADHQIGFNLLPRWIRAKSRIGAIACSRKTLERNEIHGTFARSTIVANGVAMNKACQPAKKLLSSDLNLVYFGQLERHKGIIPLLHSFSILKSQNFGELTLNLVGSGSEDFLAEIKTTISSLDLTDSVVLHGFLEPYALTTLLGSMDVAVFPLSADEPFAFVVIEAIQQGLPTLVTRDAGVSEFLPHDYPFFIEDRNEPQQIALAVSRLLSQKADSQTWCHKLQLAVKQHCDLHRTCFPRCLDFLLAEARSPTLDRSAMTRSSRSSEVSEIHDSLASWYSGQHLEQTVSEIRRFELEQRSKISRQSLGRSAEQWLRKRIVKPVRHVGKRLIRVRR